MTSADGREETIMNCGGTKPNGTQVRMVGRFSNGSRAINASGVRRRAHRKDPDRRIVAEVSVLDGGGSYRIEMAEGAAIGKILEFLVTSGVTSIRTSRPTLEEVYLRLVAGAAGRV